jgi:hypothetical protein
LRKEFRRVVSIGPIIACLSLIVEKGGEGQSNAVLLKMQALAASRLKISDSFHRRGREVSTAYGLSPLFGKQAYRDLPTAEVAVRFSKLSHLISSGQTERSVEDRGEAFGSTLQEK